jgi:hypothetical protein
MAAWPPVDSAVMARGDRYAEAVADQSAEPWNRQVVAGYPLRAHTKPSPRRAGRLAGFVARPAGPRPADAAPDVDVHSFVLRALDEHLAALLDVRARLTAARAAVPGTRLRLVADSATLARGYASRVETVLSAFSAR